MDNTSRLSFHFSHHQSNRLQLCLFIHLLLHIFFYYSRCADPSPLPPLSLLGAAGIEAASPSSSLPRSPGSFQSRKVEDPSHRYEGKLGPEEESRTKLEQVSLTRDPSERITALGNALRRRIAALEPWVAELDEVADELRERQEERDDVALVDQ